MTTETDLEYIRLLLGREPQSVLPEGFIRELEEQFEKDLEEGENYRKRLGLDYWQTPWGKMLNDPLCIVPGTREYRKFRRKFGMPAELFLHHFVPEIKRVNLFNMKYDSRIPVEIKCLIGLRILGRGSCADDMEELSGVAESTCINIFHVFIANMVTKFFTTYVKPPTGEKLEEVMDTYARLGFPGAVGSVDCTHIYWGKCPVGLTNLCTGKEKVLSCPSYPPAWRYCQTQAYSSWQTDSW